MEHTFEVWKYESKDTAGHDPLIDFLQLLVIEPQVNGCCIDVKMLEIHLHMKWRLMAVVFVSVVLLVLSIATAMITSDTSSESLFTKCDNIFRIRPFDTVKAVVSNVRLC